MKRQRGERYEIAKALPQWRTVAKHAAGLLASAGAMALIILPAGSILETGEALRTHGAIWAASRGHLAVLASCVVVMWALAHGTWQLARRRGERPMGLVRARRGTVVTETLITLPPFFLLLFGLSQQSINSMAQILANVAVHRAAEAVWVWEGEVGAGRASGAAPVSSAAHVNDRACVSAAGVMTPIAPGDYSSVGTGFGSNAAPSASAKRMREMYVFSQIPFGGQLPGAVGNVLNVVDTGLLGSILSGGINNSMVRALDKTDFTVRTALKYTAAYRACTVTHTASGTASDPVSGKSVPGLTVRMTYHHFQAMPLVGRFFSGWFFSNPFGDDIDYAEMGAGAAIGASKAEIRNIWVKTGRMGHFITINREVVWPKQNWRVNTKLPSNAPGSVSNPPGSSGGGEGGIRGIL